MLAAGASALENFAELWKNLDLHIKLSQAEQLIIAQKIQSKIYKKGTYLLEAGQICRAVYFVKQGCLRTFYLDKTGAEHNILLHAENWWAGDTASFTRLKKSAFFIQALETTETFVLSHNDLENLLTQVPKLERFFRILYQNGFSFYQLRLTDMFSLTAEQRYRKFRKIYPGLELRIAQKHIASFLGMTPVFLSMLRTRPEE